MVLTQMTMMKRLDMRVMSRGQFRPLTNSQKQATQQCPPASLHHLHNLQDHLKDPIPTPPSPSNSPTGMRPTLSRSPIFQQLKNLHIRNLHNPPTTPSITRTNPVLPCPHQWPSPIISQDPRLHRCLQRELRN